MVVRVFVVAMVLVVVRVVTMGENRRQAFAMYLDVSSTAGKNLVENLPTPARQRVHQGELFPPSTVSFNRIEVGVKEISEISRRKLKFKL